MNLLGPILNDKNIPDRRQPDIRGPAIPLAQKVMIKDVVFYASEGGVGVAPRGEYDMAECGDCRLEFCSCDGAAKKFTLSLDAVRQHLSEGRMAVVAAARR